MQSSVTKPSSSAVRVVIGGMTMRFLSSTGPMRAGVRRMFIRSSLARLFVHMPFVFASPSRGEGKIPQPPHNTGISPPSRSIVAPCSQLAREENREHHEAADVVYRADANGIIEFAQQ